MTRLFTESDFGLLTIYNSILAVALSVSTGRLDYAIIEAKSKAIVSHLFLLSATFSLIATTLGIVLGLTIIPLINGLEIKLAYKFLAIVSISVFLGSIVQSLRYVLNYSERYKELASIKVIRSGNAALVQLVIGNINPGSISLIIGKVFGDLVAFVVSFWVVLKSKLISTEIHKYKILYVLRKYGDYYKINSLHALASTLSSHFLPIVIAIFFTIEETGYYGLSYRVCILPVVIISQAIFQFYSREYAKRIEAKKSTKNLFRKVLNTLILVALGPFILLIIFGPTIFGFIFGENWTESGKYAQILSPFMFMVFITTPFVFIPIRLNKHLKSFSIELISAFFRFLSLIIGAQYGIIEALILFSLVGVITQLYVVIWIYSLIKNE